MIRPTLLLVRTSLPAVMVLATSLFTLTNILSDQPDSATADSREAIPSLAPISKQPAAGGSAILQSALFDPGRRSETIAGSVDDLRPGAQAAVAPVTIAGVLLSGGLRKAMLSLGGAAPTWSGVGEELGGWRVAAIDADGAVVERDGQSVTLKVADRYKLRQKPPTDAGASPAPPDADAPPDTQPPPPPNDAPSTDP